jgi:aspartyl-tRNA(Asn)/glutamyl-tRNA(Gln) amidotransferase subunit B
MSKYYATIGLEMHCEGSLTNSKVFSPSKNEYTELPNCNVTPIDMGFPGVLPVANKECVRMSIMMANILHARIPEYMYWERKNYYYPDLPKGYQITQNPPEECVGNGGYIDIEREDGSTFRVEIDNLHLEEDAAQLTHLYDTSTINYNRAGNPLFELVTGPCLHSADDAVTFLEYMRAIYQYCGISEADSKKGHLRCDVNVSISEDPNTLGTKVEIKNVNSFSSVRDAINYEIERQSDLKDEGRYDEEVVQETRRWDEESQSTKSMRSKVDAIDYKYFVEPNIPKFKLDPAWIEKIRSEIPVFATERKEKYMTEYGMNNYDATILVNEKSISDFFNEVVELGANPKLASNWMTTMVLGYLNNNDKTIEEVYLTPKKLYDLINMIEEGKISSKQAKEVFNKIMEEDKTPEKVVEELGMKQIGDEDTLRPMIIKIIEEHLELIEEYRKGRNVFDFFVGQVMKQTRGQANPSLTAKIIKEEIDKR